VSARLALPLVLLGACSAPTVRPAVHRAEPIPAREEPRAETAEPEPDPADLSARYADREALEVLRGRASYYSDRFTGRSTANGDRYDPSQFTAASRTLAFGTIVRVVRVDSGASVVVRINDRGPFRDHRRILDLSRAAAERLDMVRAGVIDIRAEILERPE
jgi:rare lipoprotein A